MKLSRSVELIFGKSQSGKSYLLNELLYDKGNERSIIFDFKNQIDATLRTNDLKRLYHHCRDGVFFRCVVSDPLLFPALCAMVRTMRGVSFAIDEIQTVVMGRKALDAALQELVFVGTKQRINLYITTQRPMRLHADIRSQYTRMVCFHQSEPSDRKWLAEAAAERTLFDAVAKLQPRQYVSITWDGGIQYGSTIKKRKEVNSK